MPIDEGVGTSGARAWRARLDFSRWKDADKVLLCSGLTLPFALAWLARLYVIRADATTSFYVNRAFLGVDIPFLWFQAVGHALLAFLAVVVRRRPERTTPWLVHAEIQLWAVCASFSTYAIGPFTSPFGVLPLAVLMIGLLVFEARPMRFGVLTMAAGVGLGMILPQLGVVPYAPFVGSSPVVDGVLHPAWVLSFGVPTVFLSVLVLVIHASLLGQVRARQTELERLSSTDSLTGLSTRAVFFRALEQELARSRRHGQPLAVLMIDADHFKAINDTHGHTVGDEVLRAFGEKIRAALRVEDLAARYGGEELAVLLPHTSLEQVRTVGERLLMVARTIPVAGRPTFTVSIGAAMLAPGESGDVLVARADAALYASKSAGRNRLTLGSSSAAAAE